MTVKYLAIDSPGKPFEAGEVRTVDVTNEALTLSSGFEGDWVQYTAVVKDSADEALPTAFGAQLMGNSYELASITFQSSVYDPITFVLTLDFVVPAIVGSFTIKLISVDQII